MSVTLPVVVTDREGETGMVTLGWARAVLVILTGESQLVSYLGPEAAPGGT